MGANNALATGSIVLTANADRMVSGLAQAKRHAEAWGSSMKSSLGRGGGFGNSMSAGIAASISGGLRGAGAGIGTAIGTAFGGPIGGAIGSAIGEKLGAIPGQVLDVGKAALSQLDDIAKQGSIAAAMGMTSEQFTGIAGVARSAGEGTREFIESLVTLGKVASDAASGKGGVAGDFFTKLGLDAKQFAAMRPDQQFLKFFEAVKSVGSPLERTRMLMVAFGEDGGKYLLPLLSKTPDELRRMAAGFEISSDKMRDAKAASQAWTEAQAALEKAWQDIAIAAAPVLQVIAEALKGLLAEAQPLFAGMRSGFEETAVAAAHVWDAIKAFAGAHAVVFGGMIEFGIAPVIDGFKELISLAKKLPESMRPPGLDEFIKGTEDASASVHRIGKGITDWGKGTFTNFGKSAETVRGWFNRGAAAPDAMAGGGGSSPPPVVAYVAPQKFAPAVMRESAEAYSIEMKHKFGMGKSEDMPRKQLAAIDRVRNSVERVATALKGADTVRIEVV